MNKTAAFAALVLAATTALAPTPASADQRADCAHDASFLGRAQYKFDNGSVLWANFCGFKNSHTIISARVGYDKAAGGCVTANFQWFWASARGDAKVLGGSDRGAFTECAGQSKHFGWDYSPPGSRAPSASSSCVVGGFKVSSPYQGTHTTSVICF